MDNSQEFMQRFVAGGVSVFMLIRTGSEPDNLREEDVLFRKIVDGASIPAWLTASSAEKYKTTLRLESHFVSEISYVQLKELLKKLDFKPKLEVIQ